MRTAFCFVESRSWILTSRTSARSPITPRRTSPSSPVREKQEHQTIRRFGARWLLRPEPTRLLSYSLERQLRKVARVAFHSPECISRLRRTQQEQRRTPAAPVHISSTLRLLPTMLGRSVPSSPTAQENKVITPSVRNDGTAGQTEKKWDRPQGQLSRRARRHA